MDCKTDHNILFIQLETFRKYSINNFNAVYNGITLQYTINFNNHQVKVYGKWHKIPRQQVAYGDDGIKYTFSGITVPAKPWLPCLIAIKQLVETITGYKYNFLLVNR